MKAETRAALAAVNRRFYDRSAEEFDRRRQYPWHGWDRVLQHAVRKLERLTRPLVIDVGCGNGRFGVALGDRLGARCRYLGVDGSVALLRRAQHRLENGMRFALIGSDLADGRPLASLPPASGDLVVLFGVLHHVPGIEYRRRLLAHCARRLRPAGQLAVSFWQFSDVPDRFDRRRLPWSVAGIDGAEVEEGDHLLRWGAEGADGGPFRYCHHTTDEEAAELVAASGLELIDRFRADGANRRLNLYYVLRAPG